MPFDEAPETTVDNSKALRELGLTLTPLRHTLVDMAVTLIALGIATGAMAVATIALGRDEGAYEDALEAAGARH